MTFSSSAALNDLFFGADVSGCPLPCEISSTETKAYLTNSEYIGFALDFKGTVEVFMLKVIKAFKIDLLRCR